MSIEPQANQDPSSPNESGTSEPLSFMDKQFMNTSGCGQWFIIIMVPFLALVVGLIGLMTCKAPIARDRASTMARIGGAWFVISLFLFYLMIISK